MQIMKIGEAVLTYNVILAQYDAPVNRFKEFIGDLLYFRRTRASVMGGGRTAGWPSAARAVVSARG